MAGPYSAGAIFLNVVPVFRDFQRDVAREAEKAGLAMGDQMEQSAEKAGKKAGQKLGQAVNSEVEKSTRKLSGTFEREFHKSVDSINTALGGINVNKLGNDLRREITALKKEIATLKDVDLTVDADARRAEEKLAVLEGRLRGLRDDVKIVFRSDIDNALKGFSRIQAAKAAIEDPVEIEVRTSDAERAMGAFEKKVKKHAKAAADAIGDTMHPELQRIRRALEDVGEIEINAENAGKVQMQLEALENSATRLARRDPRIDVNTNAGVAALQLRMLREEADRVARARLFRSDFDMANSFRAFNGYVLAGVTLLPALIPLLGAAAGGLAALAPAAAVGAAGLASVIIGFTGIGDAVSALGDLQTNAAKDSNAAAKTMRSASRSVESAERSLARAREAAARANRDAAEAVARTREENARAERDAARAVADARESAAEAVESALERQRQAQEAYADSVQNVREAEEGLREARQRARQEQADLDDQILANQLAQRQAMIDLFEAQVNYNAVMADGSSTNLDKEQADLARDQAELRMKNLRDEQRELEGRKEAGVEGSETVQSAEERLTDALEAQRDAQEALGESAEAVNEARVEGAERVRDALAEQAEVARDGQERLTDAIRNQQETQADGAQSIQDAQLALAQAQADYQQALVDTGVIGSESMRKVEEAMGKLGPAGRSFARYINSLRDGFYELRSDIQEVMLPSIQTAMERFFDTYGRRGHDFLVAMAAGFGAFALEFERSLEGPAWEGFFSRLEEFGPGIQEAFGGAAIKFLEGFASILTAITPFTQRFADGLERVAENFADWAASTEGQEGIVGFMEWAFREGGPVVDFLSAFADAAGAVLKALEPWGSAVLNVLTGFLEWVADMDPDLLQLIATGILAITIAMQGALMIATLLASFQLFSSLLVLLPAIIIGAIIAIIWLYHEFEVVRDVLNVLWDYTKWVWGKIWDVIEWAVGLIVDAIQWLGDVFMWLWDKAIEPTFSAIATAWGWLWDTILKPGLTAMGNLFSAVWTGIKWAWDNILHPVFDAVWAVFKTIWETGLRVALVAMLAAFRTAWTGIRWVWNNVLHPVFDALGSVFRWTWRNVIRPTIGAIRTAWEGLGDGLRWVYDNVIKPVFDFFEPILNKLEGAFDSAVNGIRKLWDKLGGWLEAPIVGFVKYVLNGGLIRGFNAIADWVGVDGFNYIGGSKKWWPGGKKANDGKGYATGGVLPGYTPGRDVHDFYSPTAGRLHLSGGEAIMRPEWTAAMGTSYVEAMNAIAAREGVSGIRKRMFGQAFRRGGVFHPFPGARPGTYKNHDGVDLNIGSGWDDYGMPFYAATDGTVTYTGTGRGYGLAIFHTSPYGELVYGHASNILVRRGQRIEGGQMIGRIGNTGNSSTPHLHFGFPGGTYGQAMALLSGSAVAGMAGSGAMAPAVDTPGFIDRFIKNPVKWLKDKVMGAWDLLDDNPVTDVLKKIPGKVVQGIANKGLEILGKLKEGAEVGLEARVPGLGLWNAFSDMRSSQTANWGAVVGRLRTQQRVRDFMAGVPVWDSWRHGAQWNALVQLVQRESSWNMYADNPTSSAAGLFQKMTSIHGPVEDTVEGQANWGLRYIQERYGSPIEALRFHNAHGYYKDGGVVPSDLGGESSGGGGLPYNGTMMYDAGGYLPPGMTTVVNLTGKPEPVFTADQWDNMSGGVPGAGMHMENHFHEVMVRPGQIADELNFAMRSLRNSGRYGK